MGRCLGSLQSGGKQEVSHYFQHLKKKSELVRIRWDSCQKLSDNGINLPSDRARYHQAEATPYLAVSGEMKIPPKLQPHLAVQHHHQSQAQNHLWHHHFGSSPHQYIAKPCPNRILPGSCQSCAGGVFMQHSWKQNLA